MKTKKYFFLFLFLIFSVFGFSQVQNPVKWKFYVNKISDSEAELILKATIDKGWHMYSLKQEKDDGPVPITFEFEKNPNYEISGKISEPKPHEEYDKTFEMTVRYFEKEVTYKQKIKILSQKTFSVKGSLNYESCSDVCVMLSKDFEFKIEGKGETENKPETIKTKKDSDTLKIQVADTAHKISSATIDDENFHDS